MKYLLFALFAVLFIGCAKKEIEILHINDAHAYLSGMDKITHLFTIKTHLLVALLG